MRSRPASIKLSSVLCCMAVVILLMYLTWLFPLVLKSNHENNKADSLLRLHPDMASPISRPHGKLSVSTTSKATGSSIQSIGSVHGNPGSSKSPSDFQYKDSNKDHSVWPSIETPPAIVDMNSQISNARDNLEIPTKESSAEGEVPLHSGPFPKAMTFESSNAKHHQSVLVVGGTDGSGTRRVVQILSQLGVTMVSEDPETYDIHADVVKGWPEVVRPVIFHTKSLQYDPDKLPSTLKGRTEKAVQKILHKLDEDSVKPTSYRLAVGGVLPIPDGAHAETIKYGFKAPVAMTLAPWWAHELPHFKIVHALRDGRDISFSANQGPVTKFYSDMYGRGHDSSPAPVKGIRLWSDWNTQLYNWAEQYAKDIQQQSSSDSSSFGYFAMHSEDLVSPIVTVRFAAIKQLADFVGSNLRDEQICCLSKRNADFMGSHDRSKVKKQNAQAQLSSRYGKWRARLARNEGLSKSIHSVGASGLRLFGYEPLRELPLPGMTSPSGYSCTKETELSEEACPGLQSDLTMQKQAIQSREVALQVVKDSLSDFAVPGECEVQFGIDYKGGKLGRSLFLLAYLCSSCVVLDCM